MADTPMIIDGNGFGGMGNGAGMGAGFIGGLVLGSLWGNGGFGWGGNGRAGQVGADVAIANSIEHVSDQVTQGNLSQLQSANALGMQVAGAAAGVTAGITQNTITGLQSQNALQQQLCCGFNGVAREIDNTGDMTTAAINAANANILSQGYEARLQNQALAAQLASQHAALSAQIQAENCQDRELMREIASQAVRDKLAETQAKVASLEAQINLTGQLSAQTAYLIDRLTPTTTPAAGA